MKKYSIFCFLILIFLSAKNFSQESKAEIENIQFEAVELEGTKIVIYYDIVSASPVERFEIELAFVDDEDFYYYPKTISGDAGPGITGGKKKRIVWDVFEDEDQLGRVKCIVNIASITEEPGGPLNALLSVPVPGLGDSYVTNAKNNKIKPYYKTILAYGLVGYGVYQGLNAGNLYDDYRNSTDRDEFDDLYNKAQSANRQSYIFTSIGAAVWLSDIVYVIVKGNSNKKKEKSSVTKATSNLSANPNLYGGVNFTYVLTF